MNLCALASAAFTGSLSCCCCGMIPLVKFWAACLDVLPHAQYKFALVRDCERLVYINIQQEADYDHYGYSPEYFHYSTTTTAKRMSGWAYSTTNQSSPMRSK